MTAFYALPDCFFYTFAGPGCRDRFIMFFLLLRGHSEVQQIIHRMSQVLFAAKIPFCRLDRRMAEQELNLLQLAAAAGLVVTGAILLLTGRA